MAFISAVHWWQEWQMRVLVLGSLFVYLSLYFADTVRKSPSLGKLRFLVWLAYVGGDALAIYSLATLFNRQRQRTACGSRGSSDLEVIWAPVLLIHLGGQPTMTAYSLEDNELWKRHAMTLVSQVSVALYVFCNWWSGERQLLNAAVLLFVVGIVKFSYKPWALKRASFTSMLASSAVSLARDKRRESLIGMLWRLFTTYFVDLNPYFLDSIPPVIRVGRKRKTTRHTAQAPGEIKVEQMEGEILEDGQEAQEIDVQGEVTTLGGFVALARRCYKETRNRTSFTEGLVFAPVSLLYKMFVDLSDPYTNRLKELKFFLGFRASDSYKMIQQCLFNTFVIVYTRRRVTLTLLGAFLQASLPFLTLTSVVIFLKSHKGGYDVNDVWVTYILFGVTALHEFLPFVPHFHATWHEVVFQVSLLSFCCRQEKPTKLMRLAAIGMQKENVNKHWYVKQKPEARRITELVRQHVKDGWQSYIKGPISYRRFNNLRGQWALERHKKEQQLTRGSSNGGVDWSVLESSLRMPFDESVLIWHVATDLCYYKTLDQDQEAPQNTGDYLGETTQDTVYLARVISEYMAYLLFIRSEMLLPGARAGLFNLVSDDITAMLSNDKAARRQRRRGLEATARRVVRLMWSPDPDEIFEVSDLVLQMKNITDQLENLGNERWKVVLGVWVEMLCFSAARCSGYLHARSLGDGGEFLSYIWLLWSAMGMETLADKISKPEPPGEDEVKQEEQEEQGNN
ncbi:uncharacterized protein LOC8079106 [Sorghum bicolor]|nr:uncharacterized protein LOC8079106 [Sorghum bicolor]|eukprot:XP_002449864.1 uncharacterized protein LOC8079106 [Sorghum bicolor]